MDFNEEYFLLKLKEIGGLQFGKFILASGETSSFYLDLRYIPAFPDLFQRIIHGINNRIFKSLEFDCIIGIPTAGVPFSTGLAWVSDSPTQLMRKEAKTHGMKRLIEGPSLKGKRVLLVDDLISSGFSKEFAIDSIREEGGIIEDIVVIIDRSEEKAIEWAKTKSVKVHSLLKLSKKQILNKRT